MAGSPPSGLPQAIRLHHVGLLVDRIETYLAASFWVPRSPTVTDPIQKARLCLVSAPGDDTPMIELIEPQGDDSPTYRARSSGQNLHHLCFEAQDRTTADAWIETYRCLPVTKWQPAVLFDGRPVRFVYTRQQELIEFLALEDVSERKD